MSSLEFYKYEYFEVRLIERKPKTNVYEVASQNGDVLGIIKWYPQWRQYCFFPTSETVWSIGCLQDVLSVLAKLKEGREG